MEKRVVKAINAVAIVVIIFFVVLFISEYYHNNYSKSTTIGSPTTKTDILVKFNDNPDFTLISGLVNSNIPSINNLNKRYKAESFTLKFKQIKSLENTYEIRVTGNPTEIVSAFKSDSNVAYARVSETDFENKIKNKIDGINAKIKEDNLNWTAGYTLQGIMTDEDKLKLVDINPDFFSQANLQAASKGGGSTSSCTDSDGGLNYTAGNVCSGSKSSHIPCPSDGCWNGTTLVELYCLPNGTISQQYYTCPSGCLNGACVNYSVTNYSLLPLSFDWRNINGKNYITSVKNQLGCGSCWAFSATGALEGEINAYYNNPSINPDLSEQDLISCGGGGTCAGGIPARALIYARDTGIPNETCFPYSATDSSCTLRCSSWAKSIWKISGYNWISDFGFVPSVEKTIIQKGPLIAPMAVYSDFYYYTSGIYQVTSTSLVGYHAVDIVGYGTYNNTYWIVKNSWGANWGELGYFRVYNGEPGFMYDMPYYINSPIPSTTYSATCEDKDKDGYCFWGLGTKPSKGCPSCASQEDCDDANASIKADCRKV